jgi:rRNA-processing protein FCF1
MGKVILDTSFILTCIKQKIDFFEQLELEGFEFLIPKQVFAELKGLSKSKPNAKLALKIIEKNNFKEMDLNTKNTDEGIIKFARKNPEIYIATIDARIKTRTRNRKIFIRGKKRLEIA